MGTEYYTGCLICGEKLEYNQASSEKKCAYCLKSFESNEACVNGHFVCSQCHASEATEIILETCTQSNETDSLRLTNLLLKHRSIKMHGPEHHLLVTAVLLTCYYNLSGQKELKAEKLPIAERRTSKIPGGTCGLFGNCGAAVGTGVFWSILTSSTTLSTKSWGESNRLTGLSLLKVAETGGPRCCKRTTYQSLEAAVEFMRSEMNIDIQIHEPIRCTFFDLNNECLLEKCSYYS